jgi:hypothetical protein
LTLGWIGLWGANTFGCCANEIEHDIARAKVTKEQEKYIESTYRAEGIGASPDPP